MIDFSSFSAARWAGRDIVFNTEPQVCAEIQPPAWAASGEVGGYDSPCFVVESEAVLPGDPVTAADPENGVYEVAAGESRAVSGGIFKACASEAMEEPEGQWPTGRYLVARFWE